MAWHTLSPASRIRVGQVLPFTIAGRLLAVGRSESGYFAIDGICPHAGASLGEGEVERDCVICPVHGYAYDVSTGEGRDDSGRVRVHRVEVEGDVLRIELPD
jgi:nitrite reductase/ring-hydroxylating ferredoxin subunit